jgi:hypothetical protein
MRPRKQPKDGQLPGVSEPRAREDGKFTEGMAGSLRGALNAIISKLNGQLSFGDGQQGSWAGNLDGWVGDVVFPAAPNTELQVLHELGRVPCFIWVALQNQAGSVYTSNFSGWGPQAIYLRSDVANLSVRLVLF